VMVLILSALFLSEGFTWNTIIGGLLVTIGAIFFVIK
jgi:uncharacterized membrane protein